MEVRTFGVSFTGCIQILTIKWINYGVGSITMKNRVVSEFCAKKSGLRSEILLKFLDSWLVLEIFLKYFPEYLTITVICAFNRLLLFDK